MIYEMRTYDLKPRTSAEFIKRFGAAYEKRRKLSQLAAFWISEIGPLNQVIHVWPYQDLAERDRIRAAAVASGDWPPSGGEFIVRMSSEIMLPWPGSPALPVGNVGPFFEMRTYTVVPGDFSKVRQDWEKPLLERTKLSPVIALWFSELGGLNKFVHIWPYRTLDERVAIRKQAIASGIWPPGPAAGSTGYVAVEQETKILLPVPFSPLQ